MENTSVLKDKHDSMLDWWDIDGSNYSILQQMTSESSIQLRGGWDIDTSYNYFITMTREPTTRATTPLT